MIPILPCPSIDENLDFYRALGFEVTSYQRSPNPYCSVRRGGIELQFFGQRHGPRWSVEGQLTIGDVARLVTFEVDFGGIEDFAVDGRLHAGFEATGEIRRSDFGLGFGSMDAMLGDVIRIQLDTQFVQPE